MFYESDYIYALIKVTYNVFSSAMYQQYNIYKY